MNKTGRTPVTGAVTACVIADVVLTEVDVVDVVADEVC